MAKNNRHGQASVFDPGDWQKLRKALSNNKYKLLFDIATFTGERWGAICQLLVEDVYEDVKNRIPRQFITFRACTRKASPDGKHQTRQVPVSEYLGDQLRAYNPPQFGYLFPSRVNATEPITLRCADLFFRGAVEKACLAHKGYSTHSTRRSFITGLYRQGTDIYTIQQITGHKDIKALLRYVDKDEERSEKAIAQFSPA